MISVVPRAAFQAIITFTTIQPIATLCSLNGIIAIRPGRGSPRQPGSQHVIRTQVIGNAAQRFGVVVGTTQGLEDIDHLVILAGIDSLAQGRFERVGIQREVQRAVLELDGRREGVKHLTKLAAHH